MVARVEEAEPGPLQLGAGQAQQPFQVLGPGRGRRDRAATWAARQLAQDRADRLAIEQAVVGLVGVAHQAVVAGRLAVLAGAGAARRSAPVSGSKWQIRRASRATRAQSLGIVDQPAEHAGAAFGRLVDQDQPALVAVGKGSTASSPSSSWYRTWIAFLRAAWSEAITPASWVSSNSQEQGVAAVFDVGDDQGGAGRQRIGLVILVGNLLAPRPVAPLDVEHEAVAVP